LKKLPNKLQSYNEAARVIKETLASNKGNDIRVLEHLPSYADNQFGQQVEGKDYRERTDGQHIANWDVDINILVRDQQFNDRYPRRKSCKQPNNPK
jgi:hypothetical protein